MDIADTLAIIAQQLQTAGLTVAAPWGPYLGAADLVIFHEGQPALQGTITVYDTRCMIAYREGQWHILVEDGMAGPGPAGLDHAVATPAAVVAFTLAYCLGVPSVIDGWRVPLHRHPEWDEARVRHALAHAQQINAAEWEQVQQTARADYGRLVHASHPRLTEHPRTIAWDEWYTCLFVRIAPADPAHAETLWLRRDLQAAFRICYTAT